MTFNYSLRGTIKHLAGLVVWYGGMFHIVRFWNNLFGRRLTIVTYHRITDSPVDSIDRALPYLFTSTSHFEKQIQFFKKYYNVITFRQLNDYIKTKSIPWNALIITFDDGYADNYDIAYPLLEKHKVPFTIFLTAQKIDNHSATRFWWDRAYFYFSRLKETDKESLLRLNRKILILLEDFRRAPSRLFAQLNTWKTSDIEKTLDEMQAEVQFNSQEFYHDNRMLTWDNISAMGQNFEAGSHTCTHSNLAELNVEQQLYEISESKKIIENETGQKTLVFCYPHGNVSENLRSMVQSAGYLFAVTCNSGINNLKDFFALKRINIWNGTACISDDKFSKEYFAFKLLGV